MDTRAIGVFDSGLGGLTAVKQLMQVLPNEDIVYFGDTGRVPYGTRSPQTITKYVMQDINFLMTFNLKMIVVACGTASTVALPVLKDSVDVHMTGVVDEAASCAVDSTKCGRIGVVATPATIKSNAFAKKILSVKPDAEVYSKACPLFVPLVENGHFDTKVSELVVEEYLSDLKKENIDTLILGCTHYPLLKKAIGRYMGEKVKLIDVGEAAAKHVMRYLEENNMKNSDFHEAKYSYFVSDSVDNFANLGSMFLQKEIGEMVNKVDIEKY